MNARVTITSRMNNTRIVPVLVNKPNPPLSISPMFLPLSEKILYYMVVYDNRTGDDWTNYRTYIGLSHKMRGNGSILEIILSYNKLLTFAYDVRYD